MNDLCVLRIYSSKGDRETPKQQEGKYCVTFFFSQVNKIWMFLLRGWHGKPTSGTDIITCVLVKSSYVWLLPHGHKWLLQPQ